eukprot:m51a1_g13832 hypothetical protein (365) ;mRNA; f:489378-491304
MTDLASDASTAADPPRPALATAAATLESRGDATPPSLHFNTPTSPPPRRNRAALAKEPATDAESPRKRPRKSGERSVPYCLLPDTELEAAYLHQEQLPQPGDFMELQSDITPPMRSMLIDWLADLASEFQLPDWTLHLAAQILDRYLERVDVPKDTLQLVGAAALLLSKKVTHIEGEPPSATYLVAMSAQAFSLQQILRLEIDMLAALEFHVWLPTASVFLGLFAEQLAVLRQERMLRLDFPALELVTLYANYIAEQGIQHHAVQQYAPSCVASSCIALSLENLGVAYWNSGLVRLITRLHGAGDKMVVDCMQELLAACTMPTSLEATKRRFQRLSPDLMTLPVSSAARAKKQTDDCTAPPGGV